MELRHLRYFAIVAEEGHVTRAAARIGIQQAPLSQQLKALERELGTRLFQRRPRGIELTEAGRALQREAREIVSRVDRAAALVQRVTRGEQGLLRIGLTSSACFHQFAARVIRAFRGEHPGVAIEFAQDSTPGLLERLQTDNIDAALVRTALAPPKAVSIIALLEEPFVIALPKGHRHAKEKARSALSLKALSHETFIGYPRRAGAGLYDTILAACVRAGFNPHIGHEAPQMVSTLSLVAAGLGIAVVPASMQRVRLDGVVFRALAGPHAPRAPLNLAMRGAAGETSSSAQAFARLAIAKAANAVGARGALRP
jgi:DNA-binding transcriptional LysR family regulator